jgi:CheY-like chemotaxis protein
MKSMYESNIIMLVDDDADDTLFFENALKKINSVYKCLSAWNGADALAKLRKAKSLPDFIFMDINMPLMGGRECLAELKKDEKLKNIPVIIYSTSNYEGDMDETRQLGAEYYLVKPFNTVKLPLEIANAIQKVKAKKLEEQESLKNKKS